MASLREWLRVPEMLRSIIRNQETQMSNSDRVKVSVDKLVTQTVTIATGVNALLVNKVNLQKAYDDLLANTSIDNSVLEALEAAVGDQAKVADLFKAVADPGQETPPATSVPDVQPVPDATAPETVPVPSESDAPALPTPEGGATEPVTPADDAGVVAGEPDASGTIPSGTPIEGATEPTVVPPLPEAPPVPTDADGNTRVEDNDSGVVDNSDGFLADAPVADVPASDSTGGTSTSTDSDSGNTAV